MQNHVIFIKHEIHLVSESLNGPYQGCMLIKNSKNVKIINNFANIQKT